jgi:hypothetical protein
MLNFTVYVKNATLLRHMLGGENAVLSDCAVDNGLVQLLRPFVSDAFS